MQSRDAFDTFIARRLQNEYGCSGTVAFRQALLWRTHGVVPHATMRVYRRPSCLRGGATDRKVLTTVSDMFLNILNKAHGTWARSLSKSSSMPSVPKRKSPMVLGAPSLTETTGGPGPFLLPMNNSTKLIINAHPNLNISDTVSTINVNQRTSNTIATTGATCKAMIEDLLKHVKENPYDNKSIATYAAVLVGVLALLPTLRLGWRWVVRAMRNAWRNARWSRLFTAGKGGVVLGEINRLLDKTRTKLSVAETLKRRADAVAYAQELKELEAQKNVYIGSAEDIAGILKHELDGMALTTRKAAATKKTTKKATTKRTTTKPKPRARPSPRAPRISRTRMKAKSNPNPKPKPKAKPKPKLKPKSKLNPKAKPNPKPTPKLDPKRSLEPEE